MKVEECVRKIGSCCESFKLEDMMLDINQSGEKSEPADRKERMEKLLDSPPSILLQKWKDAFGAISAKLPEPGKAEKTNVISFHACFYHQKQKEYFSPVDITELATLADRVKMVIVLIDDCYDIYRRFLVSGELFHDDVFKQEIDAEQAMKNSVFNLLTILSWRRIEISVSKMIAANLGVPFFVFAVKHPTTLFQRLVANDYADLRVIYLAHPISSIRNRVNSRSSGFPGKINEIAEKMINKSDNLVLFIPDTIDELRIETDNGYYLPRLVPDPGGSWPLPFSEHKWLYSPVPEPECRYDPIDPKDWKKRATLKKRKSYSSLVEALTKSIIDQITSRDYYLVEQSRDGIILFEPYWEGDPSVGAFQEAEYNYLLWKEPEWKDKRRFNVFISDEHYGKYLINTLRLSILPLIDEPFRKKVDDDGLAKLFNQLKQNDETIKAFLDGTQDKDIIIREVENCLPRDYSFQKEKIARLLPSLGEGESLSGTQKFETRHFRAKVWESLFDSINSMRGGGRFERIKADMKGEYQRVAVTANYDDILQEFVDKILG